MLRTRFQNLSRNTSATAVIAIITLVLVALTGVRTYRKYSAPSRTISLENTGLSDFHNGAYYPSLAFRDGVNPYSPECQNAYPIARSTPTYSPLVFLIHLPFTLFEVQVADVVFFIFNLGDIHFITWGWLKQYCYPSHLWINDLRETDGFPIMFFFNYPGYI